LNFLNLGGAMTVKKTWYCFRCGAKIPHKIKRKKNKLREIKGRCPSCKRIAIFVDYYPTFENIEKHNETISTNSTNSTDSTISTNSTPTPISYLILGLLDKERKPYQSIGRGIHNNTFYIGTILDYNKKQLDAVVTSDRKIYVNWGKNEYNEIKDDFGLNYRFPLFADCMDNWWSNDSIKAWLKDSYPVDIKDLFNKIVTLNKKYMIYEDERIHKYVALDIIRSYFFPLFPANSRTHIHADSGSGKTNQHMIYRALCFNPISSADFSSASIYRIIESTSGTILIDDFDLLPDEQKSAIIHHIRVNYKKFKTIRADSNKSNRPYGYNSYSHLQFNNVFGLGNDNITPERLVTLRLLKHPEAKDLTVNPDNSIWKPLRDDLYVLLLQDWVKIKECYDKLKVDGLTARELEIIKPILAIAKAIDGKLYRDILGWYNEQIEQEKLKDLSDDWEYQLLKILWNHICYLDEKETRRVFVKDIASDIADIISDPANESYKKTVRRLCIFVGKRLKGYILFKGGMTDGKTRYDIYKQGVYKILESKGRVDIVELVESSETKDIKQNVEKIEDFGG
jgi:hypothetical protein